MSLGEYKGEERLVIGMDLGTTMSAVSYSHLRDCENPHVKLIMKWPGQPAAAGDCKIPTLVRYDDAGKALLFGRAAQMNEANLENTHLAKWFKLWLHPSSMRTAFHLTPPPLPPKVTILDVYADFLGFVFSHTRKSLEETIAGNARDSLWTRFEAAFVLCLAIPNGWDEAQRGLLRQAVVKAGIMSFEGAMSRLTFVTEAEASVHFAIAHADVAGWLRKDDMFLVTDAGGSTVDTIVYKCTSVSPTLTLEEATSSECVQAGSATIDQAAEQLFKKKLYQSQFDNPDTLETILNDFEQNAKREYDGSGDSALIKTGTNFTDKTRNVTKGRLRLLRDEIEQVFAGPLNEIAVSIVRAVLRAGRQTGEALKLLTVGGFAESPRLRSFLTERLASHNINLITVDEPTKKAAAEGAAYWYAKKFVVARAARKSYGVFCGKLYNSSLPEHQARSHQVRTAIDGTKFIPDHFSRLVAKNEIVQNDASSRIPYWCLSPTKPDFSTFRIDLHCIDNEKPPYWYTKENGIMCPGFERVCTLKADMSGFERTLKPHTDPLTMKTYWRIDYAVEVFFGQTMLCAAVTWEEDSQARKGPVMVIANSIQ